jgi:hypothetical protein
MPFIHTSHAVIFVSPSCVITLVVLAVHCVGKRLFDNRTNALLLLLVELEAQLLERFDDAVTLHLFLPKKTPGRSVMSRALEVICVVTYSHLWVTSSFSSILSATGSSCTYPRACRFRTADDSNACRTCTVLTCQEFSSACFTLTQIERYHRSILTFTSIPLDLKAL